MQDNGEEGDGDDAAWQAATRGIKPLPRTRLPPGLKLPSRRRPVRDVTLDETDFTPPDRRGVANGLDKRTAERLRRGQLSIEARLDLHGMTQSQARDALHRFMRKAAARGVRCVLVITGKGSMARGDEQDWTVAPPGILRDRLAEWLQEPELAPFILKQAPAQLQHGGTGAFYVLLRRQR